VPLVVTAPDRRRGRGKETSPSPVKARALALGLAVSETVADVTETNAELGVVVAFGQIIRPPVLAVLPMVNVHFSLLPRWRGAAPVEWAILSGDAVTGVCLMAVEEGLDTGGVYARAEVTIGEEETAAELTERLGALAIPLALERLAEGLTSLGVPDPQRGESTYARKLTVSDLALDFERPAIELDRVVRVGRAWTTFRGNRLLVHRARVIEGPEAAPVGTLIGTTVSCGDGALELVEVQEAGRAAMAASAWVAGARPGPDERLITPVSSGDNG
jgi:methionyl-tRNA formyltransferase